MDGRREHDIQYENKIKKILNESPSVVRDYYHSLINKTAATRYIYMCRIVKFINYVKSEISPVSINDYKKIKPSDINKYLETLRYNKLKKGRTENGASIKIGNLYAISNFFNFLIQEGYIERNPCVSIKLPNDNTEHKIISMTPKEIQEVEDNIEKGVGSSRAKARQKKWSSRDLAILTLGCTTGLRVSAISEINIEDIDLENNFIKVVEKGNKLRYIFIGEETKRVLIQWIQDRSDIINNNSGALFISNRKQRIATDSIREIISKYTRTLDKHITPHKMRSSCATNLYEASNDIYLVQQVLGHNSINTTKRYTLLSDEKKREAADLLDKICSTS